VFKKKKPSIMIRESKRDWIKEAVSAFPFRHVENLKAESRSFGCFAYARQVGKRLRLGL
jgi:hypothetical protein